MPVLHVVRHGPTELNEQDRLRGWIDVPLSDDGHKVAAKLATQLRPYTHLPVHSSDLVRAIQTASYIESKYAIFRTNMLRPWNVGIFAGQPGKIVHPRLVTLQTKFPDVRAPFGESWNRYKTRLLTFIQSLTYDTILVTHFRVCKTLMAWQATGFRDLCMDTLLRDDVKCAEVLRIEVP